MAGGALLKLLAGGLLFTLVLAAVLLPAWCAGRLQRRRRASMSSSSPLSPDPQQAGLPAWTGWVSVLAAGTLLSVGLLDMFPDAARQLAEAARAGRWRPGVAATLGHSLALGGIALVLTVEQLALSCNRAALLALALSVHSLFEGLAMGVEPDAAKLTAYFIAVLLHKAIVAVSLGLELAASSIRLRGLIACAVGFAAMSPIGLGLGLVLMSELGARDSASAGLVGGLLQSFASGTFLYVAFFEILPREFGYSADANDGAGATGRLSKLAFLVAGFVLVTGYQLLEHALLEVNRSKAAPP